ncbi:ADP-ribosylglycohydrolase family protein [Pasteurella sp. PK-2025]|uniref:ADP-ribosylglycohydrolase family protein n=1 Tax=unclassified Pasteurella TaxID=2621516 RepID=UPI003C71601F
MLRDKVAGALFGQALGDAMGMPAELWSQKKARHYFGGFITEMLDGPDENDVATYYSKGQFTDDTAQALVLLDSLQATDFIPNPKDIAERLLAWAEKENAFEKNILGPTSKVALAAFREGKNAKAFTDQALSNGSAMRIAPLGACFLPTQPQKLVDYVYAVTETTHTSDVAIAGAAMIAMGVASAIVHDDFDLVLQDMLTVEPLGYAKGTETFSARLRERTAIGVELARAYRLQYVQAEENRPLEIQASSESKSAVEKQKVSLNIPTIAYRNPSIDTAFLQKIYDIVGTGVQIIESVPAAIALAYYAQDPNVCSYLCANLGGDTDTIGAMATAICGAFTGLSQFNPEWRALLCTQNDIDFDAYIDILLTGRQLLTST